MLSSTLPHAPNWKYPSKNFYSFTQNFSLKLSTSADEKKEARIFDHDEPKMRPKIATEPVIIDLPNCNAQQLHTVHTVVHQSEH